MKHKRAFKIKYIGPTNYKGERVGIKDLRFNKNFILTYDYSKNNIKDIALEFFKTEDIKINSYFYDELSHEYYFITESFEPIRKDYINPKTGKLDGGKYKNG